MAQMNFDEGMAKAIACKEAGTGFLKAGDFQKASFQYHLVYMHVGAFLGKGEDQISAMTMQKKGPQANEAQKASVVAILIASYNNLVLCQLNLGKLSRCVELSQKVLDLDPGNSKVRLRRCMARTRMGDIDGATEDLAFLTEKDPGLLEGLSLGADIEKGKAAIKEKEKIMFKGMSFS